MSRIAPKNQWRTDNLRRSVILLKMNFQFIWKRLIPLSRMFLSWCITHQKVSLARNSMIAFCSTGWSFDGQSKFPKILESIKVDTNLHVQLHFNGNTVPLPPWFINGHQCIAKLTLVSMLENLPAYIRGVASDSPFSLIDELNDRRNFQKERPSSLFYSFAPICTSHQIHISASLWVAAWKISSALFFTS